MRKLRREWKDKEDELLDENKTLKSMVNKLKNEIENEAHLYDKEKDKIIYEIKSRDSAILDLEKALEQARRSNLEMKNDFAKFSEDVNGREH